MNQSKADKFLIKLRPYLKLDKCKKCECLQGFLFDFKREIGENLDKEIDEYIHDPEHQCLGCDPCVPAELWTKFRREGELR